MPSYFIITSFIFISFFFFPFSSFLLNVKNYKHESNKSPENVIEKHPIEFKWSRIMWIYPFLVVIHSKKVYHITFWASHSTISMKSIHWSDALWYRREFPLPYSMDLLSMNTVQELPLADFYLTIPIKNLC